MRIPPGLAWDACALLNLAATGRAEEILQSLGCPSCIVARVRVGEALFVRPLPEEDPHGKLVPVAVGPLLDAALLQDVNLDEAEQETFAELAGALDDGEARTLAIAAHRQLWVATDDRAAIRLARSLAPPVPIWTTPEWIRHWADTSSIAAEVLGGVLRRIQLCARYTPRRDHALKEWWDDHLSAL